MVQQLPRSEGRDFVDRDWKLGSTADAVRRVIEEGHELLGMPAYGSTLSAGEIDAIADSSWNKPHPSAGSNPPRRS